MTVFRILMSVAFLLLVACSTAPVGGLDNGEPSQTEVPLGDSTASERDANAAPASGAPTVEVAPMPAKLPAETGPSVDESEKVVVEATPHEALPAYTAALSEVRAGNDADAKQALTRLAEEYPELSGPHTNLGLIHYRAGQLEQAQSEFTKALSLNPASATSLNQLGVISREQGRFQEAYTYYQEALKAAPDYALVHRNLGILLDLYLDKPAEALLHYKQYQALTEEVDETVRKWIIDLGRRVGQSG